ncbi:WD40 repeat domain-containing protein [Aliidiomarina sp. Khilg15.8]
MAKLTTTALLMALLTLLSACSDNADRIARHERAESRLQAAAISHDGELSLVASSEHGLLLIDLKDNSIAHHWQQDTDGISQIRSLALAADNSVAIAASRNTIGRWDIDSGEVTGYWRLEESDIQSVAVANGGQRIVIGRSDGIVMIFEPESGRRLEFLGHSERINSVDISPNGRYVLSGADDHKALLWRADSGQVVHEFPGEGRITQVRLHPDGSFAFSASGQAAHIWRLTSGEQVSNLQHHVRHKSFVSAAFSPDGEFLVTGSPSRHAEVWRVNDGERVASFQVSGREGDYPPRAAVIAVAFVGQSGDIVTENSAGFGERWHLGSIFE